MTVNHNEVSTLFQRWIINPESALAEQDMFRHIKDYLISTHPRICGQCSPCYLGVPRLEELLDLFITNQATSKTLDEFVDIVYHLRASLCSIGLDIGRNLEVVLRNNYHVFYREIKEY